MARARGCNPTVARRTAGTAAPVPSRAHWRLGRDARCVLLAARGVGTRAIGPAPGALLVDADGAVAVDARATLVTGRTKSAREGL